MGTLAYACHTAFERQMHPGPLQQIGPASVQLGESRQLTGSAITNLLSCFGKNVGMRPHCCEACSRKHTGGTRCVRGKVFVSTIRMQYRIEIEMTFSHLPASLLRPFHHRRLTSTRILPLSCSGRSRAEGWTHSCTRGRMSCSERQISRAL